MKRLNKHHEFLANSWVQVGVVGKPYGIRGAFYISGRDEPLHDAFSSVVIANKPQQSDLYEVSQQKVHKGRSTLLLKDHEDRSFAEGLVGRGVWVLKEELSLDEEGEYFWDEVVGLKVLCVGGNIIGKIHQVSNYGASDVVEIRNDKGAHLELPFIASYFDMAFTRDADHVQLLVGDDFYGELWQEPKSKF